MKCNYNQIYEPKTKMSATQRRQMNALIQNKINQELNKIILTGAINAEKKQTT